MRNKANELIQRMKAKGLTLAFAESITCGLAATKLSSCIGTSDVLQASLVCYTPEAKMQLLNIEKTTIDRFTCESPEVTREMVNNLAKLVKADVYAALTGLASPGGSESKEKPVGTVFFAVRFNDTTHAFRKLFRGTPSEIKLKAAKEMYKLILQVVTN